MSNNFGWLEVHAVDHCNHNCRWCHNYSPFAPKRNYEAREYFDGLDVLKKNNINYHALSVMGGEPFLHSNLIEFSYTLLERYRKPLMLTTNGFWLSAADIDLYKDLWRIVSKLRMSRYPTIMKRLGGAGRVAELLERIKQYNHHIVIDFCGKEIFNKLEFWDNPADPQVYCGNVECTALLPDMTMGRCGAGAYTRFAPDGMISDSFLNSKDMMYDLRKFDRDSFWLWRKKYPLDACSYCNFSQKIRSVSWKVEKGRKPFNHDMEMDYHIAAGAVMINQGYSEQAAQRMQLIREQFGETKELKNLEGLLMYSAGNIDSAAQSFKKALEIDPAYLPALRNLRAMMQCATNKI
jgi:tetratricopeptide (TPR) repeat protein